MSTPPHINDHNRENIEKFRANGGQLIDRGMPLVLITHVGRKSGRSYTNPLTCAVDEDGTVVIGATKGGLPTHPDWYLNIEKDPMVTVEWAGEQYRAEAQTVPAGPERERLVALLTTSLPALPRYEEKTAGIRLIPIIRLVRQP